MVTGGGPVATWTVLFTDLVESTSWRVRVGEVAFDRVRNDVEQRVSAALRAHDAAVTKSTGDGVMAGFASTASALRCAVAIQRAIDARNAEQRDAVALRIGVSVGDAVLEAGDLHGTAVVEAARLCSAAAGGTILCTDAVVAVSANRSGCSFGAGRPLVLKGLPDAVLAHVVTGEPRDEGLGAEAAAPSFRVLGHLEVGRPGAVLSVGGPKERIVLALLLARVGDVVTVDALVEALWHDDPPRTAARTTHAYVARVRRALAPFDGPNGAVIATVGRGYRLDLARDDLDATRFERLVDHAAAATRAGDGAGAATTLEAALALWRGDAFIEFGDVADCLARGQQLDALRWSAFEDRIDAELAAGRDRHLIGEVEGALASQPYRERLWGQLMLALYRSGRQREALEVFQRARTVLAEDLGLQPGPELRHLEAAILEQSPSLDLGAPSPSEPARVPLALEAVGPAFVGRSSELARLRASWAQAAAGLGSFVSVTGPEGIGKTRLVAELAHEVHDQGAVVLYGRCDHAHRGARPLVEHALAGSGIAVPTLRAVELDDLAAHLTRSLPGWVGDRPVLLVLDDLHLADAEALAFVADLAGWTRAAHMLVIGAFRGESQPVDDQDPSTPVAQLVLTPLAPAAVEEISALYRPEGWAEEDLVRVFELSGGVPLLVHEHASALARDRATHAIEAAAARLADSRGRMLASRDELAQGVTSIQLLLEQRRAQLAGREAGNRERKVAASATCPYKGLTRFEERDAADFFGREQLVAQLVARVAGARVLTVVGPSGSGKSSLVRAGLLPALGSGVLASDVSWDFVTLTPGERPVQALDAVTPVVPAPHRSFAVFVDQFEEMFTLCRDDEERDSFVARLVALSERPGVTLIFAVRADHLGRCAAHPALADLLDGTDVIVGPMREAGLRRAIEMPAARAGLEIEPGLVDLIVRDVGGRGGALPLLSTALAETWERRERGTLTLAGYRAAGGVNGALARLAEDAYNALPPAARPAAQQMLLRLCDPGDDGTLDVRRRLPLADLVDQDDLDAVAALDGLADRRLVIVDGRTVEVAHEALLREWPRLRLWLEEDVQGRQVQRRVRENARAWAASGRDDSELARGTRLDAALELAASNPRGLNRLEREYLDASRALARAELEEAQRRTAERERANVRLRRLLVATALLLLVAVAAGTLALREGNRADDRARDAEVSRLLAQAQAQLQRQRDLGLLLAVEAQRAFPSPETDSGLLSALQAQPSFLGYLQGLPDSIYSAASFTNGGDLIVGDEDGGVTRFETQSVGAAPVRVPVAPGVAIGSIVADPFGVMVAVALRASSAGDGRVVVLSLEELVADPPSASVVHTAELSAEPTSMAFDTRGHLAIGTADGTTAVFDATWQRLDLDAGDGPTAVTYATNGQLLTGSGTRLRVWDTTTMALVEDLDLGLPVDGQLLLSGDHLITAARVAPPGGGPTAVGSLMAWSVSGRLQAWSEPKNVVCTDVVMVRSDVVCGQAVGRGPAYSLQTGLPTGDSFDLHAPGVAKVVASQDARLLAVVASGRPLVAIWRMDGGSSAAPVLSGGVSYPVGYSADSRFLMTENGIGGNGFSIGPRLIWDVRSGSVSELLPVLAAVFAPSGKVAALRDDGTMWLIEPATGVETPLAPFAATDIVGVANDEASGRIAIGLDGGAVIQRDSSTGDAVGAVIDRPGALLDSLAYLAGGTVLAVAADGEVRFFDADSGAEVLEAVRGDAVATSSDGEVLVTATVDGVVTVRDPRSGQPSGPTLDGPRARANTMAVSGDHRWLVVAGWDGSAQLYDLVSRVPFGQPFTVAVLANEAHLGVAVRPDGREFAVATDQGIELWPLDPVAWRESACRLAGRNLTEEEWRRYMPDGQPYRPTCEQWPVG